MREKLGMAFAIVFLAAVFSGIAFLGYVEFMARYRIAFGDCVVLP